MTDERSSRPPQAVVSYAGGIAARTAQRQEERRQNPVFPNLAQAAVTHRANQDEPQTLEDVGREQRADAARPEGATPPRAALSEATVEGLKALKQAQETAQKPAAAAPESKADKKPAPAEADDEDPDPEDLAFADALRSAREDVIQNDRERKAVATRVKEIDLATGLLTGEFTQVVPVVPDKLEVKFRCLTTGENNELRLMLYEQVRDDPRKAQIGSDLLAFYQTVASVVSVNKTVYVKHMVQDTAGRTVFNRQAFDEKLSVFMTFPLPLIASLGTHGAWFEQRVRELFATTDRLKNG
jgi:hypothetical protein